MGKELKASTTVEFSLLFIIIIFIFLFIVYTGIYLHDKSCLQGIVNGAVTVARNIENREVNYVKRIEGGLYTSKFTKNEIETTIYQYIQKEVGEKLFEKDEHVEIKVKWNSKMFYNQLEVEVSKKATTPEWLIGAFFEKINGVRNKNITIYICERITSRENMVRTVDFLDDVTSEIIVTKEVKDRYLKVIDDINKWFKRLL